MTIRERINPKTGEVEYKARYYFITGGKRHDSETGWLDSPTTAINEAERLKEAKEKADKVGALERQDKKLSSALEDFVISIKKQADTNKSNSDKHYFYATRSLMRKHTPQDVLNTKVKDISIATFRNWVNYINADEELGGITTRTYIDMIKKFNNYLASKNYYTDDSLDLYIEVAIKRIKIKSRRYRNKEDAGKRNLITPIDIEKITSYFAERNLGKFRNFYYYTMFYLLFYSGMRVEEMVALQWKFIDLDPTRRTIDIKNSISYIENRDNALRRVREGEYRTKNRTSTRQIPIFDFYYELLIDYKESFKYEYGLSKEQLEEAFVFPSLRNKNPFNYLDTCYILKLLKSVCAEVGIKKTDLQMFRHSCATFLIMPPPDGLGFTETKVKDYFGHEDVTMLQTVYARLDAMQKAERMRDTFASVFKPAQDTQKEMINEMKLKVISRVRGDNPEAMEARKNRVFEQIILLYRTGRRQYYYNSKDKWIIDEFAERHKSYLDMRFIEED